MSSSAGSTGGKKSSRGGNNSGGRGRGRGGRRGGRGRSNSNRRSNNTSSSSTNTGGVSNGVNRSNKNDSMKLPEMSDEDVLIAFMPYMRGDNQEATSIHETYQSKGDQKAFLQAARQFLCQEKAKSAFNDTSFPSPSPQPTSTHVPNPLPKATPIQLVTTPQTATSTIIKANNSTFLNGQQGLPATGKLPSQLHSQLPRVAQLTTQHNIQYQHGQQQQYINERQSQQLQSGEGSPSMQILERKMAKLLSDDDDIVTMPSPPLNNRPANTIGPSFNAVATKPSRSPPPSHSSLFHSNILQQQRSAANEEQNYQKEQSRLHFEQVSNPPSHGLRQAIPGSLPHMPSTQGSRTPHSDILSSLFSSNPETAIDNHTPLYSTQQPHNQFQSTPLPVYKSNNITAWSSSTPSNVSQITPPRLGITSNLTVQTPSTSMSPKRMPLETPTKATPPAKHAPQATPAKTHKTEFQPKRLWTHLEEQPGKVLANDVAASVGRVLNLRPRQELTARWILPLSYLKQKHTEKDKKSARDLLKYLSVGLFRRGCTENGFQASIISKEILCPDGESRDDYPFRVIDNSIVGTVPFYSPRTPGHVVFRLYWRENPLYTLATGPTLNVRVTENDFESSIRFILSNFKGKKVNPTSLSSLNSLALVLEQFQLSTKKSPSFAQHQFESAGRAVWGCVCESRKVLDACSVDYQKTTIKLEKLEESVEELKEKVLEEEQEKSDKEKIGADDEATQKSNESTEISLNVALLREKTKSLMSGRASCERKWRDSQLAFASILRAIVTNASVTMLLRRDLITKLRLEFELWCPLCEEFAVPGDSNQQMWYEPINKFSQPITNEHFRVCSDARSKMQIKILGFDPNTTRLGNILYTTNRDGMRQMNPGAVNCFNQLSSSMGQLYKDVYFTADSILQQRESIRSKTERLVSVCDCFPRGTKVAIFGSSANGYGSPKSDLDMCLQVPNHSSLVKGADAAGAEAMATLAKILEENGMVDVDTSRLTARIPVIKFNCPCENVINDEQQFMECDISMHNPLAVLNTELLRSYAEINPVSRVMASVIKRWAKARDINDPARHTLSSYGYILMLLHFLTYHKRSGDGLVIPMEKAPRTNQALPLLPNLKWMDSMWPESPPRTPYAEFHDPPKLLKQHPREENVKVNAYFYRMDKAHLENLRQRFPGQDLSLAILLASFFRYYAYDFDYKRHVVSLNSTNVHGIVEREVKAELDGWRNYSAALTIEDPFETFYDVAHVLRGGYYHRIRREFAVAYSKIADVAMGRTSSSCNNRVVDLTGMTGMELIDWICEPVVSADREEGLPAEK
mmetsp:Transcript_27221/g.74538  ORF Transcript_27221/g.74538 Transcript_27221/m.74538 type:complete len:1312 (-) Transcript_27221:211-4146(-)|eukprot:CAMPEP_0172376256 /NCGR_PEP_ID=MMETSP1060-20121228/66002_1 /TAXON_ID=37318 /ORGANISM="Pseudo-nitzschia pungens, Strain cf. cingulata" /LENGTH=1311 /DNA_ID=CAMNT_0013103721 /DNA_START=196 /DNA_END=4131 /DNA_ORIENTATION=+